MGVVGRRRPRRTLVELVEDVDGLRGGRDVEPDPRAEVQR